MVVRRAAAAGALSLALGLAGCGGGGLSQPSLVVGGSAAGQAAGGAPTPDKSAANPFQDFNSQALVAREVIANPTLDEIMQPAGGLTGGGLTEMALGRADAPVTLIKYASMTCPYCRQFQMDVFPELKRQYIDTGKMRLILREFPIGFQSGLATIALRCVPEAKYFQVYDRLMRTQNQWASQEVRPEPIAKAMADLGLSGAQLEACRQNKELVASLDAVKQRGRLLGIVGTPNYFINGRLIKHTLTLKDVKAIVDPLLAGPPAVAQKS